MQLQENWWFSKFHLEMAANPVCTVEDDYIFTSCHDFISYSNLEYHVSNSIPKWILKNQAVDCERRRPKENSKIIDDRFVQSPKREKIVYVTTHDLFIVMTHPWYQKPPLCTRNSIVWSPPFLKGGDRPFLKSQKLGDGNFTDKRKGIPKRGGLVIKGGISNIYDHS